MNIGYYSVYTENAVDGVSVTGYIVAKEVAKLGYQVYVMVQATRMSNTKTVVLKSGFLSGSLSFRYQGHLKATCAKMRQILIYSILEVYLFLTITW